MFDGLTPIFKRMIRRLWQKLLNRRKRFRILDLPIELQILITQFVGGIIDEQTTDITLFDKHDKSLFALSLVNKQLRLICIAVGLFWRVNPHCIWFKNSLEIGHTVFHSCNKRAVRSLCIDLGNEEAWTLYYLVMEFFPHLDELRFTGTLQGRQKFYETKLASKIRDFHGSSLVFSGMTFDRDTFPLFGLLSSPFILSLSFRQGCIVNFLPEDLEILKMPPFPNAISINFDLPRRCSDFTSYIMDLLEEMLSQITGIPIRIEMLQPIL